MRRLFALLPIAALGAACAGPDHIEIEPKEVVLKRPKETTPLRGKVMNRRGTHWADKRPKWQSGDEKVATVDEMGVVSAVGNGRTTLTATYGDLKAEVPVEVKLVESLMAEPAEITLPPDSEGPTHLKVTVVGPGGKPLTDRAIRYMSMDESVATIDGAGGVWSQNAGETLVKAIADEHEVAVKVKVEAPKAAAKKR